MTERRLPWVPVLRRQYLQFQRLASYGVVGIGRYRGKPIELGIKLPLSPDELRACGHKVEDPYPKLVSNWDAANRQWALEAPGATGDSSAFATPTSRAVPPVRPENPGLPRAPHRPAAPRGLALPGYA